LTVCHELCFEIIYVFKHLVAVRNVSNLMQELLEKFEFFPLKCHVQRALETFKINQGRRDRPPKLKMKVRNGLHSLR
jgi:hypothetical protein